MEAAPSSQYSCTHMSAASDINPCQFLEELMGLLLGCQDIEYSPILTYQTKLGLNSLTDVVSTILDLFEIMSRRYEKHIHEVVSALRKNSNTEEYFQLVGKRLLIDRQFEWKYFRVFLALVSKLSDMCYKKKLVFLSDDIVVTTARFIEKDIQSRINELKGWKNFEKDCEKICLMSGEKKDKEKVKKPPKPPNSSVFEMPSSSGKLKEIHSVNFNNETFGRCYVFETPEENHIEPIVYLGEAAATDGFQDVRPPASKEDRQMEMAIMVAELIEISMLALGEISCEMEF